MKLRITLCVVLFTAVSVPSYGSSLVAVDRFADITTFDALDRAIKEHGKDPKKRELTSIMPSIPEPSPENQKIGISRDEWCKKYQDWPGCIESVINGIRRDAQQN